MNKLFSLFMFLTAMLFIISCDSKKSYQYSNIDWTRFRGSDGSGISIEKGWDPRAIQKDEKIKPVWIQKIGIGYSSVSIKGDYIYTMGFNFKSSSENIFCINIKNGKIKWQYNFHSTAFDEYMGSRSTPALENMYIYAVGSNGKIFCLDALKGNLIWQKDLIKDLKVEKPPYGFSSSPVIEGDLLLINANQNGIALNKNNGNILWISDPGKWGYATPVIFTYNNVKYAAIFGTNKLFIVEVSNGNILTSYDWHTFNGINAANPVISGNKIFISSDYGNGAECLELSGNKLNKLWSSNMSNHFTTCVLIDNCIYGVSGNIDRNTSLKCLDFNTGKELWEDKSEKIGSFIVADTNKMIGISTSGKLFINEISRARFKKISETRLRSNAYWTSPVLCRGMIFVRNQSGDLYCIDVRE